MKATLAVQLLMTILVLLLAVDVLHDHVARRQHLQHLTLPALVAAGEHDHLVAFPDLAHRTSGASEMIFMNADVRSSRVTGPKIRVPIGSSLFVSNTAALPSKRMSEPS